MEAEERKEVLAKLRHILKIIGPKTSEEREIIGSFNPEDIMEVLDVLAVVARELKFEVQQDGRLILFLQKEKRRLLEEIQELEEELDCFLDDM